jgi:predicted DNA-binding protein with PD1-like motif
MGIKSAKVQLLGGIDKGSRIIVGPREGRSANIEPMVHILDEMYEAVGNGTIFCNESGTPKLHCHLACGRGTRTICGEIREGVIVWHVLEVIITEFQECDALRKQDIATGFELLVPGKEFRDSE